MRSRGAVGKRVKRVVQTNLGKMDVHVDDGTRLVPKVAELDGDYAVNFLVVRKP